MIVYVPSLVDPHEEGLRRVIFQNGSGVLHYQNGVQLFLNFALCNSEDGLFLCPCKECKNGICRKPEIVEAHLLTKGFVKGYTKWVLHGESLSNSVHVADSFAGGVATSDDMMELQHTLVLLLFNCRSEHKFS